MKFFLFYIQNDNIGLYKIQEDVKTYVCLITLRSKKIRLTKLNQMFLYPNLQCTAICRNDSGLKIDY